MIVKWPIISGNSPIFFDFFRRRKPFGGFPRYAGVSCKKRPKQDIKKYRGNLQTIAICLFLGYFSKFSGMKKRKSTWLFQKQASVQELSPKLYIKVFMLVRIFIINSKRDTRNLAMLWKQNNNIATMFVLLKKYFILRLCSMPRKPCADANKYKTFAFLAYKKHAGNIWRYFEQDRSLFG